MTSVATTALPTAGSWLFFLAIQQVQVSKVSEKPRNPVFHDYYHRKIAEGKTKKQALVCVMRRLVNIVYGMMKHRTSYVMPDLTDQKRLGLRQATGAGGSLSRSIQTENDFRLGKEAV